MGLASPDLHDSLLGLGNRTQAVLLPGSCPTPFTGKETRGGGWEEVCVVSVHHTTWNTMTQQSTQLVIPRCHSAVLVANATYHMAAIWAAVYGSTGHVKTGKHS